MVNLELRLDQICGDLTDHGWAIVDNLFSTELVGHLAQQCRAEHAHGRMKDAGVGQADGFTIQKNVRGDLIQWLTPGADRASDRFLEVMEQLRSDLNQQLYLGLQDTEHHFALYPPGAFYQRHLDRFRDDDRRVLSSILYLNQNWEPQHGGALRIVIDDEHGNEVAHDIDPVGNRLVLFISAQIAHEVLPTNVERLSLTGWFRRA